MSAIAWDANYRDLPMEILLKIMGYLNLSDIFEAGLTCRRWFEASTQPEFMARTQIHLDRLLSNDTHEPQTPMDAFRASARYYESIRLSQVEADQLSLAFWNRMGQQFAEIIFDECYIDEKILCAILRRTGRLESLELNNCRDLFMCGSLFKRTRDLDAVKNACKNIRSVSFSNNRYLSDGMFCRTVDMMGRLVSLNLSGCQISIHRGLCRRFYPPHNKEASESVLTFNFILQYIGMLASTLKCLDFSKTLIDSASLTVLAETDGLHLERLVLRSCDQLTNSGISALVQVQTSLTELDLSASVRLTDPSVLEICRSLKQLKVLKLRKCRALTDLSIRALQGLRRLECLDISECDAITSSGVIAGIASEPNGRMLELHASALNICELAVIKIAENMENLQVLDLSYCKNAVTDLAAQMIFKHLINISSLNLEFCDMISDAGITGMEMRSQTDGYEQTRMTLEQNEESQENAGPSNADRNADMLDHPVEVLRRGIRMGNDSGGSSNPYQISLRSKAEETIVNEAKRKRCMLNMIDLSASSEKINCSPYSIGRLRRLRILNLASCNQITDVSLKSSFDFLDLKELSLSRCQQISATGIESLLIKCPSIETLNLAECHNLSDEAIEMITSQLKRLTRLSLERCSKLTDLSLDAIAINCKRLKQLNLRGCRSMGPEPNLRLEHIHSLHTILISKPGPYMIPFDRMPKCPPLPPRF